MDHLWTPWRYHYISSGAGGVECVFCAIRDGGSDSQDAKNFVLVRASDNYVVLNRFPYTSGHLLVVLNRHCDSLVAATESELFEMISLGRECQRIVSDVYQPEGFNIGFNLGECAGAGVAGHLHLHVVPRWVGDSNVVGVLGQTRIIPETLESSFERLHPLFQNR